MARRIDKIMSMLDPPEDLPVDELDRDARVMESVLNNILSQSISIKTADITFCSHSYKSGKF